MDDSVRNIALFGVDSRNGDFTGLSDVVMILTVDNKHGKIKMTSILRDSGKCRSRAKVTTWVT